MSQKWVKPGPRVDLGRTRPSVCVPDGPYPVKPMNVIDSLRLITSWYNECVVELWGNMSASELSFIECHPAYEDFEWFSDDIQAQIPTPTKQAYGVVCTKDNEIIMCSLFYF